MAQDWFGADTALLIGLALLGSAREPRIDSHLVEESACTIVEKADLAHVSHDRLMHFSLE